MQNITDHLFGTRGTLQHLAAQIALIQKAQQSVQQSVPAALQAQIAVGNVKGQKAVLFVKNNAVKQKLFNLQKRLQEAIAHAEPACQKVEIKINPQILPAPKPIVRINQPTTPPPEIKAKLEALFKD